jgi:hypothetical protein
MTTESLSSNNSRCLSDSTASIKGDLSAEEQQTVSTLTRDPWLQVLESLDEEFGFDMLAEETAEKN